MPVHLRSIPEADSIVDAKRVNSFRGNLQVCFWRNFKFTVENEQ